MLIQTNCVVCLRLLVLLFITVLVMPAGHAVGQDSVDVQPTTDKVELLMKRLVKQECLRTNITVTEDEICARIEGTASKFGMSSERYVALIYEKRNVTARRYRNEIVWYELALRKLIN